MTIKRRTKMLYGAGAFGYGSVGQTLNSFLMFFGTGVLGISGTLMGVAVGVSTVWDATTDPIVGNWSDKTKSRLFGKRHGFILFAGILVAVVNLMLWSVPPHWSGWAKFAALLVLLLVIETFNTCYSTPYSALGLDLSQNYNDRTAVQNYKTAFSFLSLLVPTVLMGVMLSDYNTPTGYVNISIVTSILCVVCAIMCFAGTPRTRTTPSPEATHNTSGGIFENFFGVMRQKNVGRLIAGYAISLSAGAFLTSLGLHVFTYTFHFSAQQIPIVMLCLIAGIIAGQPIWYVVSRKSDKITALVSSLGMLLVCMSIFSVVIIFRQSITINIALYYVCFAIFASGIATGCLYSLPISMFADCIAKNQRETGEDKTGISAGFFTFCNKISNAFIMFVIGISLDIIGFNGAHGGQSLTVQNWLGWLLIAGVVVSSVFAMFVYAKYTYTREDFV